MSLPLQRNKQPIPAMEGVASTSARRLQINSKQSSETINQSLRLIAASAAEIIPPSRELR